jgi:hypothetical protein
VDQSTNWAKTIVWCIPSGISMDRLVVWPSCSGSISECFVITGLDSPQSLLRGAGAGAGGGYTALLTVRNPSDENPYSSLNLSKRMLFHSPT